VKAESKPAAKQKDAAQAPPKQSAAQPKAVAAQAPKQAAKPPADKAQPAPAKAAAPVAAAPAKTAAAAPQAPAKAAPSPVATPTAARAAAPPPVPRGAPVSLPPPTHRPASSPLATAAANRAAPRPKEDFKAGDHVVYPTHGVGMVQGIETIEAAGYSLSVIVVTFEENRMTLRVPVNKAASSGLRKLATGAGMQQALDTLKGRARIKRTMWSRRAQEYEAKINSGDPVQIAEVVRDLHRNAGQPDQSFSERQIYEQALDRLAAEVAAIDSSDKAAAIEKLLTYLGKADKGEKGEKMAEPAV
jgi:CarD family transcriptional regulator